MQSRCNREIKTIAAPQQQRLNSGFKSDYLAGIPVVSPVVIS